MSANEQVGIRGPNDEYDDAMASFVRIRNGEEPAAGLIDARIRLEQAREVLGLTTHRLVDFVAIPAVGPGSVVGLAAAGSKVPNRPQLEDEYCSVLADLADKIWVASKLCGDDFSSLRSHQQRTAFNAKAVAEIRAKVYQDAVDNGNFGTYLEMREMDARMTRSVDVDSHQAEVGAARAASTDQVQAVAALNQRLANESYAKQLAEVAKAREGSAERAAAVEHMQKAARAARLADSTLLSLMAAQSEYRDATVAMVLGNEPAATASAMAAAQHMGIVADKLDRFGIEAPKARMFPMAMNSVLNADKKAGLVAPSVERKVEDFVDGLKGFAQSVRALSEVIKSAPAVAVKMAASACASVSRSAVSLFDRITVGVTAMVQRSDAKLRNVAVSAETKAWTALDAGAALVSRVADNVDRATSKALEAADKVDLHVRATAGLAGGLLGRAGRAVAGSYASSVEAVRERRSQVDEQMLSPERARSPRPR